MLGRMSFFFFCDGTIYRRFFMRRTCFAPPDVSSSATALPAPTSPASYWTSTALRTHRGCGPQCGGGGECEQQHQ